MEYSVENQIKTLKHILRIQSRRDKTRTVEFSLYFLKELNIELEGNGEQSFEERVKTTLNRLTDIAFHEARPRVLAQHFLTVNNLEKRYSDPLAKLDRSKISFGNEVTFEPHLPRPWVKYPPMGGIVCTFADHEQGSFVACFCSKRPLQNLQRILDSPISRSELNQREYGGLTTDPWNWTVNELFRSESESNPVDLNSYAYIDGICHQCRRQLPLRQTATSPHHSLDAHFNFWNTYLLQEFLRWGLRDNCIYRGYSLEDQMDEEVLSLFKELREKNEIYEALEQQKNLIRRNTVYPQPVWLLRSNSFEKKQAELATRIEAHESNKNARLREIHFLHSQIRGVIVSKVRSSFNLPESGFGSIGEEKLFMVVQNMFPDQKVEHNVRPPWLQGLEIDVWLPEKFIGFEFQGEQHFNPIEHWGGEESLKNLQERDRKKSEIFKSMGYTLITVNFNDPIDEKFLRSKLDQS